MTEVTNKKSTGGGPAGVVKFKYMHLTDYEKRAAGMGAPPGRTTFRIELFKDGEKRSAEDVKAECDKIKEELKERNKKFMLANTGSDRVGRTHENGVKFTEVIEHKMIPDKLRDIRYGDLELVLDAGTGNTGCIFGSSKRGKTFAMMHIFRKYYSKVPTGGDESGVIPLMFARNIQLSAYDDKRLILSDEFRPDVVVAEQKLQRISKNKYEFVNFIDDFIDLKHSVSLDELILTYRNSLISSYICLQYVNTLSKAGRSNVNNVLLFGQNTDEAAEVCVNVYLKSWFKSLKVPEREWVPLFHKVTMDHGFFHVHPASGAVRICKLT